MEFYKLNLNHLMRESLSTGVVQCSATEDISGYKSFEEIKTGDILVFTERGFIRYLARATSECNVVALPGAGSVRQVPFDVLHTTEIPFAEMDSTEYFMEWVSEWVKADRGEVPELKHRNSFMAMQFCTHLKYLKKGPFLRRAQQHIFETIERCGVVAKKFEDMADVCNGNYDNLKEAEINFRRIADDLETTIIKEET